MKLGDYSVGSPLPEAAHLEDHLDRLLDIVEPASMAFRELVAQGFDVTLSCGLLLDRFNRGVDLPARTVQRLGALGLRLGLDIYCCEEPEDDGE